MGLPTKIKKNLPLTEPKTLLPRRQELLDKINKDGTFLPKSLLHADLDGGMLDFVKNELKLVVEGKTVPTVDIVVTLQNWSQFTETWNFQNIDKNAEPPFITTIRNPEVKFGTNPSLLYNIPNRRQYFYAQVPTWDGQRNGMDVYTIPQPVPVDITYSVKIVCNRMREINKFNQIILEKFASRQSYAVIKGHYIPIIMGNITDESVMEIEKRKYYIQSYEFTMLGFLIDEDEFEVSPAITRVLQVVEFDKTTTRRNKKKEDTEGPSSQALFLSGVTSLTQLFNYVVDINIGDTVNVDSFDVYINGDYYGSDLDLIQINNGDTLQINVVKDDNTQEAVIKFLNKVF
ncbi:MAG: hypothetical protein EBS55_08695 [Flavobacteriaceae bacterium]|nr:hypothetical protein [Flavobacteriaceae bacterium]